jgi:hypothetical protein
MVVVTGGPGVGKSLLGVGLATCLASGVVVEPPAGAVTKHDSLTIMRWFKDWLVLGAQIAQSGRYLVIPSFARPHELDQLPERAWIGSIHWLVLVCDAEVLERRLRGRRKSRTITEAELDGLIAVHEELRVLALERPAARIIDTSALSPDEVVEAAVAEISDMTETRGVER